MKFEEVYRIVEESSNECAFNRDEALGLFSTLLSLSDNAVIVEIGVEFGRSTAVINEVSKIKSFDFTAIDPFIQDNGLEAQAHIENQTNKYNWKFNLIKQTSEEAYKNWNKEIDLIHIDGNHEYNFVKKDIELWTKHINKNGYVLFDDYGHDSLPDVLRAVNDTLDPKFKLIAVYGNKLGVFKCE